jgi:hypothetical protein
MPESLKTARICFIVAACLEFSTAALFVFVFIAGAVLVGWGTESSGLLGSAILGATGVMLALLFAAFGVVELLIAAGIAKGRAWSRFAGILLAVLLLAAIPVGTVLGIFALKGLLGPDARTWFGSPNGVPPAGYRLP